VQARSYIEEVRRSKAAENLDIIDSIEEQLEEQVNVLTTTILQCMSRLAHSVLWGENEHNRRLKMLITLGCENLAADAFCSGQVDLIRRAVRAVESTGDPLNAADVISTSFFNLLSTVSLSFLDLFGDRKRDPHILSLLLSWAHGQIQGFVPVFASQVCSSIGTEQLFDFLAYSSFVRCVVDASRSARSRRTGARQLASNGQCTIFYQN
jgi:hypothetical protein